MNFPLLFFLLKHGREKEEKISSECPICLSPYTAQLRKLVECVYCQHCACTTCVKKYLLSIQSDPRCMNCSIAWSMGFLDDTFSHAWRKNEYKQHRQKVLMEREISMLPHETLNLQHIVKTENLQEQIKDLRKLKVDIDNKIRDLNLQIQVLKGINPSDTKNGGFVRACPTPECRGFLSNQWKCVLCHVYVCSQCHGIKKSRLDQDHKCKDEDVKTAQLLNRETKPCPGCGTPITKISGCNQMFCHCKTPFDWKTGKVITGPLHNPHYYDFLRLHPEESKRWNPEQKTQERLRNGNLNQECKQQFEITVQDRNVLMRVKTVLHLNLDKWTI